MKHQFALITGVAGGIGQELYHTFSNNGYTVLGLDHVCKPLGWNGAYFQVDLERLSSDTTYSADVLYEIRRVIGIHGLRVLINNAAVQVLGGADTLHVSDWQRTLNVNLIAPFLLIQGMLPNLEASDGCVINISSIHARLTKPNFVAYATSKAALSAMTRAMAVDLGDRVRINAIEPAAIATEMLKAGFQNNPEAFSLLESCHPQRRVGKPAEVASLALSIANGDLRFLHGACIGFDGGISGRLFDPL